jgi:hypothetical protein
MDGKNTPNLTKRNGLLTTQFSFGRKSGKGINAQNARSILQIGGVTIRKRYWKKKEGTIGSGQMLGENQ